jgi:hypothetical protein
VRAQLAQIVGSTDHAEIAAMEQQLMAEGMPVEEVRAMCDLHAEVLRDVMTPVQIRPPVVPGHPAETFERENRAITAATRDLQERFAALAALPDTADPTNVVEDIHARVNTLFDIERHYQRKELLLFPLLERHGITGPSKVMWAKDDEVREQITLLGTAFAERDASVSEWRLVVETIALPALSAIDGMVYKEEHILLPLALDTLTRSEWGEVWRESPRIGWCLVEPAADYRPPEAKVPSDPLQVPLERAMVFSTGHLTLDQLQGIFAALPVDLTFVDADDRVAFYSEGPHRVFARSRTIIGRKVQHCHPPRSVSIVDRILEDFRSGTHDVAEFWIEFHGRFVHIRYFAVRSAEGAYQGCLEVTQDVTAIRALTGERRLLHYDEAQTVGADGAAPSHEGDGGTRSVASTSGRNGGAC